MGQHLCASTGHVPGVLQRKPRELKAKRSPGALRTAPRAVDLSQSDPARWALEEVHYGGRYSYHEEPVLVKVQAPIASGLERVRSSPAEFDGVYYQSNMATWPERYQKYTLVRRTGSGFSVRSTGNDFTWVRCTYLALSREVSVSADAYTDRMTFRGAPLGVPLLPGRGQGCADVPGIKLIGQSDPNDVVQGGVGDCWLLSAMSALAEYDGAVARLLRRTPQVESLPSDAFNTYVVTLYDLPTWTEVDITVDERLCTSPETGGLLGTTPSVDAELWACYLEKAVAAHCGGWDNINGGHVYHGFRLLTGCKYQYTFFRKSDGDGFGCYGAFNPNKQEWEQLTNSTKGGFKGLWPMSWPEVGGGGHLHMKVQGEELFQRMCAWDDANYVMCAGTKPGSDTDDTNGIVDGHAYTILECVSNAGGTDVDLVKVRNPHGKGEIHNGRWNDNGSGWELYPSLKKEINPTNINDGVFWVDKQEFFTYFKTIYLCAQDMAEWVR